MVADYQIPGVIFQSPVVSLKARGPARLKYRDLGTHSENLCPKISSLLADVDASQPV